MYFLSKFCIICIRTNCKFIDLDTVDFDNIKLCDKLSICSKTEMNTASNREICNECLKKLRISYQFSEMCRKSSKVLENYFTKLIGDKKTVIDEQADLSIFVTPLVIRRIEVPKDVENSNNKSVFQKRKQRITKGQRCSLLKRLLLPQKKMQIKRKIEESPGGLKSIINFTQNYKFTVQKTPLDKLTEFSNNFFKTDFSQFRDVVLYVIENRDKYLNSDYDSDSTEYEEYSEDDNYFEREDQVKFEAVFVESELNLKEEPLEYDHEHPTEPYEFVEALYQEDNIHVKEEEPEATRFKFEEDSSAVLLNDSEQNHSYNSVPHLNNLVTNFNNNYLKFFHQSNGRSRVDHSSCYINQNVREQFLHRSFLCDICKKCFKSQGYLNAHVTKVH